MPLKQVEILGVNVNSLTMAQAVEAVQQFIADGKCGNADACYSG